jgi:hypothetical protein
MENGKGNNNQNEHNTCLTIFEIISGGCETIYLIKLCEKEIEIHPTIS